MTEKNVWTLLLEEHEDAVKLAEDTVAAAIGADNDPTLLTNQLGACTDYIFHGPDEEIGRRTLRLAAAFAGISRGLTNAFGALIFEVQDETRDEDEEELSPDVTRNAEMQMLFAAAEALRATIANAPTE